MKAGTGKTTLVNFIISALNLNPDDIAFISYTGKASLVLREKGNKNSMTAHKLLYDSIPKEDGTFIHKPKSRIAPYKMIVVDEVSMIPNEIWELLISHRIHVIALGDPGQLPAISTGNKVLDKPHIFLDEIMRQALDSEIVRVSMDIRMGKHLPLFNGEQVKIIDKKDIVSGMYTWADQIIVAENKTKNKVNNLVRKYLYDIDDNTPIEGDKVVCLKNNWDLINTNGDALVNGSIGYLENISYDYRNALLRPRMKVRLATEKEGDCDYWFNVSMDYKLLTTGEPTVNKDNWKRFSKKIKPNEFDYGYAITCWKAQGSEYDKVLVFEENFPFGENHIRYLYTACTRTKKRLVIVRK